MRKTQIDSLLKKCKSKAFKTIHEALKKCLNIKLPRLPQNFITNIKIDFNKIYLEKSILEIYKEHKIISSIEEFMSKKYLIEDKVQVFKDFLSLTFRNVFEYYINSKQYVKDYYHIQQREGEKFAILFNYISKIFIQYYTKSKGNRPKGTKKSCNSTVEGVLEQVDLFDRENRETDSEANDTKFLDINGVLLNSKKKKKDPPTQQIKRKPVFKRIKVKRVSLKKKIIKVCEVSTASGTPIFEIRKFTKNSFNDSRFTRSEKLMENVDVNI
jgi:hypothetical protein